MRYCVRVSAVLVLSGTICFMVLFQTSHSDYNNLPRAASGNNPWLEDSYRDRLRIKLTQTGRLDQLANSDCEKRLPTAIIIGVMKAGTEAFSTFIGIHPQIAMQFGRTSAMFFNSDNYFRGYEWYKQLMMCSTRDQITMEKSPQYFSSPKAPERINKMDSNIKLIVLLRNPIDRAVSHFLQMKHANPERLVANTFEGCVTYPNKTLRMDSPFVYQSTYSVILKRWLEFFPLNQILFIDGDGFKTNALKQLHQTEKFLSIPRYISSEHVFLNEEKGFFCIKINSTREEDQELSCLGNGKGRSHPSINKHVERKLQNYFKPHNEELFRMIKKRLPW